MLKTLIIATVLLPKLAIAQQSQQLPQPRQPANGARWAGWRAAVIAFAEGPQLEASWQHRHFQVIAKLTNVTRSGGDEQMFGGK